MPDVGEITLLLRVTGCPRQAEVEAWSSPRGSQPFWQDTALLRLPRGYFSRTAWAGQAKSPTLPQTEGLDTQVLGAGWRCSRPAPVSGA